MFKSASFIFLCTRWTFSSSLLKLSVISASDRTSASPHASVANLLILIQSMMLKGPCCVFYVCFLNLLALNFIDVCEKSSLLLDSKRAIPWVPIRQPLLLTARKTAPAHGFVRFISESVASCILLGTAMSMYGRLAYKSSSNLFTSAKRDCR